MTDWKSDDAKILIAQVKKNVANYQQKINHYTSLICEVTGEFVRGWTEESNHYEVLEAILVGNDINSRKIVFGITDSTAVAYERIVAALIDAGAIDKFMDHLVNVVLPRFVNKEIEFPDFTF